MKLMHIAGGGDRGGAKTHILNLCRHLSRDTDLTLISMRSGEFPDDAQALGIKTKTFFSRFVPGDYIRLLKEVRRQKPDIVHCHGAKANVAGVLIKLFCRSTIVTTVHSDYRLDYMQSFLKRNTIGRMNSAALRYFDYYVTVSDNFAKMLTGRGFSPTKIMTIYNGLDFNAPSPKGDRAEYLSRAGLKYEEGDVILGILARLDPVKDIATLLRAFALAQRRVPNIKLIIGGEGDDMSMLKALAKELGIEKSVGFLGWITDVPAFFSCCDIDVLCSISESFPYSILEGVREGCAVITSDVGGMRDLIQNGENGYIFAPKDVDAFAEYIVDLAKNPAKRADFAAKLFETASSKYSLESMSSTQTAIYSRLLTLEERAKTRDGVLVCGAYGRGNSGDESILKAIIDTMRQVDPLLPICVMTRKPAETRLLHMVDAMYTFNLFSFLRKLKRTRLYINGGGSLIQDMTSSRSLYYYLFTIWAAKKRGCRVLMYGCGIGQVHLEHNRRISGKILDKNVDIITLRDPQSVRELESMGVTKPDMRMSADPALCLTPASVDEVDNIFLKWGLDPYGKYICFSLRSWKDFDSYDVFTTCAKYAYEKYGLTALFLPIERPKDFLPSQQACEGLDTPHKILEGTDDVELTIAMLKKMELVCAMRLHALVFSAAAKVPFIGVSYDIKVEGFMEYAGIPQACSTLGSVTAPWLKAQIDEALKNSESRRAVSGRLHEYESRNAQAARELLQK